MLPELHAKSYMIRELIIKKKLAEGYFLDICALFQ